MTATNQKVAPPRVRLVGQIDHPDFADAFAMMRAEGQLVVGHEAHAELTVVAQSRPGGVSYRMIESLRRDAPLSGFVALLGTWCEGETRTGRPWPGIERLYWYEFPAWWRRQIALRASGQCPDWSRNGECGMRGLDVGASDSIRKAPSEDRNQRGALIMVSCAVRDTAMALADVLQQAGYAAFWRPPGVRAAVVRGATAGIWDGGQLSEQEAARLAAFCRELKSDAAPVIALLDFPRRDRCELARQLGAAAILGKPWFNVDLVATIELLTDYRIGSKDVLIGRAA
jgi:hypothetical protein